MSDYASEGGHFYKRDGTPFYTIVGLNGNERQTTLRDARKLDLVPGVSTIIQCAARPGLEAWKREQTLLAALTLPRLEGESEKSWLSRVIKDSTEQGRAAADRGTEIHGAFERFTKNPFGWIPTDPLTPWLAAAMTEIEKYCGQQIWRAEKSYAHKFGYGCKIDLHSPEWLIDYKGKDDEARGDLTLWDEHFMQLAANRVAAGIPHARCAIVFFGRQTPWATFMEAEERDLSRGWDMFSSLLTFWQAKNKIER